MIQWSDDYCLGVDLIDHQHQELFRAINRLLSIVSDDGDDGFRSQRSCMEALKYLKNYTIQHFQDEEIYQIQVGYEGYIRHKEIHDNFKRRLLIQEGLIIASNYSRDTVRELVRMLTDWLLNHIIQEDQDIVRRKGGDT